MKKGIYSLLRGNFLVSEDAFKSWRLILFVSVLAIIMIASSHRADQKVYQIAQLVEEVKQKRSQFVETRSRLMKIKLESNVRNKLVETGLIPSKRPPHKIIINPKSKVQ